MARWSDFQTDPGKVGGSTVRAAARFHGDLGWRVLLDEGDQPGPADIKAQHGVICVVSAVQREDGDGHVDTNAFDGRRGTDHGAVPIQFPVSVRENDLPWL